MRIGRGQEPEGRTYRDVADPSFLRHTEEYIRTIRGEQAMPRTRQIDGPPIHCRYLCRKLGIKENACQDHETMIRMQPSDFWVLPQHLLKGTFELLFASALRKLFDVIGPRAFERALLRRCLDVEQRLGISQR